MISTASGTISRKRRRRPNEIVCFCLSNMLIRLTDESLYTSERLGPGQPLSVFPHLHLSCARRVSPSPVQPWFLVPPPSVPARPYSHLLTVEIRRE
jgi:hypothetical protein